MQWSFFFLEKQERTKTSRDYVRTSSFRENSISSRRKCKCVPVRTHVHNRFVTNIGGEAKPFVSRRQLFMQNPGQRQDTKHSANQLVLAATTEHKFNIQILKYSLVQRNWFSVVAGCTWVTCISDVREPISLHQAVCMVKLMWSACVSTLSPNASILVTCIWKSEVVFMIKRKHQFKVLLMFATKVEWGYSTGRLIAFHCW